MWNKIFDRRISEWQDKNIPFFINSKPAIKFSVLFSCYWEVVSNVLFFIYMYVYTHTHTQTYLNNALLSSSCAFPFRSLNSGDFKTLFFGCYLVLLPLSGVIPHSETLWVFLCVWLIVEKLWLQLKQAKSLLQYCFCV